MENIVMDKPNVVVDTVPVQQSSGGLEAIAQKMAAMRNQIQATNPAETGQSRVATQDRPVAPQGVEVSDDNTEPEIAEPDAEYSDDGHDESAAPEEVSQEDSTSEDLIDFLDFANTNPNAKFKFMRNGKEVVIDAKKAAAILGQGAAISEDARQLKIQRSEFDEYLKEKQSQTEGLLLAMEFTVRPQLQKSYDEIIKTQNYQSVFQQQLAQTRDPAQVARIQAAMTQNERYIQQQSETIKQLKPNVDQFYEIRRQQVSGILESNRKAFQDKELKNEYVYNEVRDKVAKGWTGARGQLIPGIDNLDLISSDEHILGLLRDGLKYRDKPKSRQAGNSIAALTSKRSNSQIPGGNESDLADLRNKARGRGKEATQAADNLLVAQLRSLRAARTSR
jgi:hypothetical protein